MGKLREELQTILREDHGTILVTATRWNAAITEAEAEIDRLTRERDEARSRFNDIDLCKEGQAPCEWALKLIAERDAALAKVERMDAALKQISETDTDGFNGFWTATDALDAVIKITEAARKD